jgi:5-(hydroxymethyl)furfural/furfural oxidase
VARIIVENDSAKGVEVVRNGSRQTITAANVIVCAGAIHSPHLLQLSGLGPADALRRAGVDVVRDLPGVGANLQNHAILYLGAMLRPAARQSIALKTHPTACFRLTAPGSDLAGDISVNVQSKTSWNALGRLVANVAPVLWRPFSTGRVGINPGDRFAEPEVVFNLLSDERDLPRMLAATRLGLRLFQHLTRAGIAGRPYFVKFDDRIRRLNAYSFRNRVMAGAAYGAASLAPGLLDRMLGLFTDQSVDPTAIVDDDAGLSSAIKQNVAGMFHPVGTCRIGRATDPQAVVSPKGKVHGFEHLYVVDS